MHTAILDNGGMSNIIVLWPRARDAVAEYPDMLCFDALFFLSPVNGVADHAVAVTEKNRVDQVDHDKPGARNQGIRCYYSASYQAKVSDRAMGQIGDKSDKSKQFSYHWHIGKLKKAEAYRRDNQSH
jgi:hypothetical protein